MINTQIAENVYYNSKNSQKSNANFVMGYALNLCKSYIYNVPYNHNISEEGMEMTQNRVRIVDVADTMNVPVPADNIPFADSLCLSVPIKHLNAPAWNT